MPRHVTASALAGRMQKARLLSKTIVTKRGKGGRSKESQPAAALAEPHLKAMAELGANTDVLVKAITEFKAKRRDMLLQMTAEDYYAKVYRGSMILNWETLVQRAVKDYNILPEFVGPRAREQFKLELRKLLRLVDERIKREILLKPHIKAWLEQQRMDQRLKTLLELEP